MNLNRLEVVNNGAWRVYGVELLPQENGQYFTYGKYYSVSDIQKMLNEHDSEVELSIAEDVYSKASEAVAKLENNRLSKQTGEILVNLDFADNAYFKAGNNLIKFFKHTPVGYEVSEEVLRFMRANNPTTESIHYVFNGTETEEFDSIEAIMSNMANRICGEIDEYEFRLSSEEEIEKMPEIGADYGTLGKSWRVTHDTLSSFQDKANQFGVDLGRAYSTNELVSMANKSGNAIEFLRGLNDLYCDIVNYMYDTFCFAEQPELGNLAVIKELENRAYIMCQSGKCIKMFETSSGGNTVYSKDFRDYTSENKLNWEDTVVYPVGSNGQCESATGFMEHTQENIKKAMKSV